MPATARWSAAWPTNWIATARIRWPPKAPMITRCSGGPSAPVPIWRGSGANSSDDWHIAHLIDPRSVVPASIMPAYPWLGSALNTGLLRDSLATLARLGVPYDAAMVAAAETDALAQSTPDSAGADGVRERYGEDVAIRDFDGDPARLTEMDALVAYLQSLGTLTDAPYTALAERGQ